MADSRSKPVVESDLIRQVAVGIALGPMLGCPADAAPGGDTQSETETEMMTSGGTAASSTSTSTSTATSAATAGSGELTGGSSGGTTPTSSSGDSSNIECTWFDEPGGDRSWGLCGPPQSWSEGEAGCNVSGGNLVSIASAQDGVFAINVLGEVGEAWIGLNDVDDPGTFTWTDGTPYSYMNWDDGQPDNPKHSCVAIGTTRRWFDYDCGEPRRFVCARPL